MRTDMYTRRIINILKTIDLVVKISLKRSTRPFHVRYGTVISDASTCISVMRNEPRDLIKVSALYGMYIM